MFADRDDDALCPSSESPRTFISTCEVCNNIFSSLIFGFEDFDGGFNSRENMKACSAREGSEMLKVVSELWTTSCRR